jgi:predicted nucleic acid-binding protein
MLLKIYVDTSVIGGCFDHKFRKDSLRLFEDFKAGKKQMIYSDLVYKEIQQGGHTRDHLLRKFHEVPEDHMIRYKQNEEVELLAEKYLKRNILTGKSYKDAIHVATGTIFEADVIASWNFRHIVNKRKIKQYNETNIEFGYRPIAIKTPEYILNQKK